MVKKIMTIVIGLLVTGLMAGALTAAPRVKKCNDLKIDRCKERQDCVWVETHKNKEGKEIKAHCKCKGKCN